MDAYEYADEEGEVIVSLVLSFSICISVGAIVGLAFWENFYEALYAVFKERKDVGISIYPKNAFDGWTEMFLMYYHMSYTLDIQSLISKSEFS